MRMKDTIDKSDIVIAEDTRRTGKLLNHLGIKKKMISMFVGNEKKRTAQILNELQDGKNIALLSDAGTPLLSDPGFLLVRDAICCFNSACCVGFAI